MVQICGWLRALAVRASRRDASRIQDRNGAENFALLRRKALSLLKQHPRKDSVKRKRKAAALDPDFLAETLARAAKPEKVLIRSPCSLIATAGIRTRG